MKSDVLQLKIWKFEKKWPLSTKKLFNLINNQEMQITTHLQLYIHQIAKKIKSLTKPALGKTNTTQKLSIAN